MIIPVITTISRFLRLTPVAANNIQTSHICKFSKKSLYSANHTTFHHRDCVKSDLITNFAAASYESYKYIRILCRKQEFIAYWGLQHG